MAAAVVVTSPAGAPTPECPIWLQANEAIVAATQHVLGLVNERKDHIPPVVSADVVSFPYEISLPGETEGALLGSLRRMLTHASPPTLV